MVLAVKLLPGRHDDGDQVRALEDVFVKKYVLKTFKPGSSSSSSSSGGEDLASTDSCSSSSSSSSSGGGRWASEYDRRALDDFLLLCPGGGSGGIGIGFNRSLMAVTSPVFRHFLSSRANFREGKGGGEDQFDLRDFAEENGVGREAVEELVRCVLLLREMTVIEMFKS